MASNPEFVQYIADQLAPAGQVTYHKMFGDYGVYLDGKMFALVCDDSWSLQTTEEMDRTGGSSCSAATQSPAV